MREGGGECNAHKRDRQSAKKKEIKTHTTKQLIVVKLFVSFQSSQSYLNSSRPKIIFAVGL